MITVYGSARMFVAFRDRVLGYPREKLVVESLRIDLMIVTSGSYHYFQVVVHLFGTALNYPLTRKRF